MPRYLLVFFSMLSIFSTTSASEQCRLFFAEQAAPPSAIEKEGSEWPAVLAAPENLFLGVIPSYPLLKSVHVEKIQALRSYQPRVARGRKEGISKTELQSLFERIRNHDVVGVDRLSLYDPERRISFCFGRAVAFHVEALRMGINKDSVKKAWVTGRFYHGLYSDRPGAWWRYHTATVIKGEDGAWWAMDPRLFSGPVVLEKWYLKMSQMADDRPFGFFVTEAKRVFPAQSDPAFFDPRIENEIPIYFRDYFASLRLEIAQASLEDE